MLAEVVQEGAAMIEQWLPASGFETHYEVSSFGRVRRSAGGKAARVGRVLHPTPNTGGYPTVWLSIRRQRFARMVHLLVAKTFLGRPLPGFEVNHKDGNKLNASVHNLEYVTHKQNSQHASKHGLMSKGTQRYNAVVDSNIVWSIRIAYCNGEMQKTIAQQHGIRVNIVQGIVSGRTWAWLR